MDTHALPHSGVHALRRASAARTVVDTTGGPRTTVLVRPFVKENQK